MPRVTRGHGFLEQLLARLRARKADSLLPEELRSGLVVDIGCGSFPLFLTRTRFARKLGLDRQYLLSLPPQVSQGIELRGFDAHASQPLPLADDEASAVTLLAVFEHIRPDCLVLLLTEIHRVLVPGGVFVLTTPSSAAEPVLRALAAVGGISKEEFEEHTDHYSRDKIRQVLRQTPFAPELTDFGLFELGMNVWVRARKQSPP
ncbi:MAG: class I SAM-dependent methyltransferase [Phycisphaerales bacterium]